MKLLSSLLGQSQALSPLKSSRRGSVLIFLWAVVVQETDENMGSASIVFWFLLGLLTPLLGGFTFGLIMAAVGAVALQ